MAWYGLHLNLGSQSLEPEQLAAGISNTRAEPVEEVSGGRVALPKHEAGSSSCHGMLSGNWGRKLCWGEGYLS